MYDFWIRLRNSIIHFFYTTIFKPLAFRQDPEDVHDRTLSLGKFFGSNAITQFITSIAFNYSNESYLSQEIKGIKFNNPIGLAAGFDKNAELTQILDKVGFGFEEIGSITGEACTGNQKPRLWRAKKSKSLLVYYGLKNDGAEAISKRLKNLNFRIPIGISVAKTNCELTADTNEGIKDYVKAYKLFENIGDYYTINISCPNAFGGQPFTDAPRLEALLKAITQEKRTKPIFIKLSPDLSNAELDSILELSRKYKIDGLICSNLTKNRNNNKILDENLPEKGGFSGKVQEALSDKQLEYIYKKCGKEFVLVGCGGVFTAEDAYRKIKLGASLIQMITGMVFQGPQTIGEINRGLVELLKKDGYKNITEAVGKGL